MRSVPIFLSVIFLSALLAGCDGPKPEAAKATARPAIGEPSMDASAKPIGQQPTRAVKGDPLGAATPISITTNVTKNCSQASLPFTGNTYQIQGVQAPYGELTLSNTSAMTLSDGIGNVQSANLQLLYILSDSLDTTATFYSAPSGGGDLLQTLTILQGVPYEWDLTAGAGVMPCSGSDWQSMTLTAGTTARGTTSTANSTNVHIRSSLSN